MQLFSLFGNPVGHSISPRLHNSVFQKFKMDACYVRKQIDDPKALRDTFHAMQLQGANVTVPHKEVAFEQCNEVRGVAKEIGAVNTLVREGSNVIGYNTDAEGFFEAIKSFTNVKKALILGAGGTAKALAIILKSHKISTTLLNRSTSRLSFFEERGFECFTWDTFTPQDYDLIINTTSAGLKDEAFPCPERILEELFSKAHYAFDVIYNQKTPFLRMAEKKNLTCKDGKEMLLYQAVLAFNLFCNHHLEFSHIEQTMKEAFTL